MKISHVKLQMRLSKDMDNIIVLFYVIDFDYVLRNDACNRSCEHWQDCGRRTRYQEALESGAALSKERTQFLASNSTGNLI